MSDHGGVTTELVSYALAGIGLLVMGWAIARTLALFVDRKSGNAMMLKLLGAGNVDRTRKLCAAAPSGSYFDAIKAGIVAGQATASRDRAAVDASVGPAFETAALQVAERWRAQIERGLVGAMLVAGGVVFAMSGGILPLPLAIAGGCAALGAAYFAVRRRSAEVTIGQARREIVPAIVKAIVDGPPPDAPKKLDDTGPFRTPGAVKRRELLASLRDGACPLCSHTTITRVEATSSYKLVCRGCGYTQEFADLEKLG